MKRIIRSMIDVLGLLLLAPLFLPMVLVAALAVAWRRFELWLYYDGDKDARDRDEWRNS